jgi:predicted AAA+ superfamily ATPase
VFLWPRNQFPFGKGLYFAKGKKECDFILIDRDQVIALILVCWSIENPDTLKREIDGLIELSSYFKCDKLMLTASSEEKELNVSGLSLKIVSAWKLLLQNNLNI